MAVVRIGKEICDEGGSGACLALIVMCEGSCLTTKRTNGKTINMSSCVVEKSRCGEELEILVKNSTVLNTATENASAVLSLKCTKVGRIEDLVLYKRYNIVVKVLKAADEEVVNSGLHKQDLVVADDSGSVQLTLWEDM